MTEKVYKIKLIRLIEEWIAPSIVIIFFFFLAYNDYHQKTENYIFKIVAYLVLLVIFVGPFCFLFFNHLYKSSKTQLRITAEYIELLHNGNSQIINLTDIKSIAICSINNKYGPAKAAWCDIFKWKIKSNDLEIIFSSLIISKSNLKKFFMQEFVYEFEYIPAM